MTDPSQISLLMKLFGPVMRLFGRYARLESRVSQLEADLEKRSANACPKCGGRNFFIKESIPQAAFPEENTIPTKALWYTHIHECEDCQYSRIFKEDIWDASRKK